MLLARSAQHAVNARQGRNGAGIGAVAHLLLQNRINSKLANASAFRTSAHLVKKDYLGAEISEKRIHSFILFFHHAIETGTAELFPFREVLSQQ